MTKKTLTLVFFVWLIVDAGCLAIAKRGSWLFGFGVRGLVTDFLLALVIVGVYLFRGGEES